MSDYGFCQSCSRAALIGSLEFPLLKKNEILKNIPRERVGHLFFRTQDSINYFQLILFDRELVFLFLWNKCGL